MRFGPTPNSSSPAAGIGDPAGHSHSLCGRLPISVSAAALGLVGFNTYRTVQDRAIMQDVGRSPHGDARPHPTSSKTIWPPNTPTGMATCWPIRPKIRQDLLDPDTLVLAHYMDADADKQLVDWDALQAVWHKRPAKGCPPGISEQRRRCCRGQVGSDSNCRPARRRYSLCREQCRLYSGRRARNRGRRASATDWTSPSPPTARSKPWPIFAGIS